MGKSIWDPVRNCEVFGPYKNKHGRLMMVRSFRDELGKLKRASISYPKWLIGTKDRADIGSGYRNHRPFRW